MLVRTHSRFAADGGWLAVGDVVGRNPSGAHSVQLTDLDARCTLSWFPMSFARLSLSLVGVVGVLALALAGATIWLLVTQPVTVADAVSRGEVSPLAKAIAGALYDALSGILKYL
jgi:hypothetical protein